MQFVRVVMPWSVIVQDVTDTMCAANAALHIAFRFMEVVPIVHAEPGFVFGQKSPLEKICPRLGGC